MQWLHDKEQMWKLLESKTYAENKKALRAKIWLVNLSPEYIEEAEPPSLNLLLAADAYRIRRYIFAMSMGGSR